MDASSREPLLHQAMDRFVHRVGEWKATSGPYTSDRDVVLAHKDGLYRLMRDSGLQPWELHTVLQRASEYGLVAPELGSLWPEVLNTSMHYGNEHGADHAQQHVWGAPGSHLSKQNSSIPNSNGGMYGSQWVPANGRSSSAPVRPPGLEPKQQQPGQQQYGNGSSMLAQYPPAAGVRSPLDTDTTPGTDSDQQNSRKQQPSAAGVKQVGRQAVTKGVSAAAGKGTGKQQQRPAAAAANGLSSDNTAADAAVASSKTPSGMLPNGHISAWRHGMDSSQQTPAAAATNQQQQQRQGSQGVVAAPAAAAAGWEVQEPLDLLPSGLLDDVYDQGDAVVEAPFTTTGGSLLGGASAARNSNFSTAGPVDKSARTAAVPGRAGRQQQPNKQQRQLKQQHAAAAAPAGEQQQQVPGRQLLPNGQQQQQQQQRPLSFDGSVAGMPPPSPSNQLLGGGIFSPQQGDLGANGLLHSMQPRQSLDGGLQQQHNAALQQQHQARLYQQQQFAAGLGAWGAGPMGYMQPLLGMAPTGPMQPPPPPRNQAAAAAAGPAVGLAPGGPVAAAVGPTAAAPTAAAARPAGRVNYAAVAAAAPHPPHLDAGSSAYGNSCNNSAALGPPVHQPKAPAVPLYHPPAAANEPLHHQQPQQQQQQAQSAVPAAAAAAVELDPAVVAAAGSSTEDAVVPPPVAPTLSGLSLFHTASMDSPVTPAIGGPMSPYPSPLQRSLSTSAGASPALQAIGLAAGSSSSAGSNGGLAGMAPMLLPPAAVPGLGAIGEPVGSFGSNSGSSRLMQFINGTQQQQQQEGPARVWTSFGAAVAPPAVDASQQQQQQQLPVSSLGSVGTGKSTAANADGSTCSAASDTTATAISVAMTPHSNDQHAADAACTVAAPAITAGAAAMVQQPPPPPPRTSSLEKQQQQQQGGSSPVAGGSPTRLQPAAESPRQQQPPPPPAKPMTWAQKVLAAKNAESSNSSSSNASGPAAAAAAAAGPRVAPAPLSETQQQSAAAAAARRGSTGQALLAAAKQQEAEAEAAAAAAVPSYSEAAALDGLDAVTAKAAVTAASRMPLPAKMIQAWRSGLCLASCIKLLQSQRTDLGMALNDRIKGWLCQDCDRSTAECLVLFVLTNLRRDWHLTAKSPGAFLMGLLQHRAALIGGSGMSRKLLEVARNFPNVAVYIDSDVLQELGDMEPSLRCFVMDEYMCKQRGDWPEGLKFPSQCLLSCMRSIRYADPAVHKAYINLMETRPDLGKAMNGVILYGLCKCDAATGLAAVKRLSELPADWTSAARVNASAFLYQKVQELCGGHCY